MGLAFMNNFCLGQSLSKKTNIFIYLKRQWIHFFSPKDPESVLSNLGLITLTTSFPLTSRSWQSSQITKTSSVTGEEKLSTLFVPTVSAIVQRLDEKSSHPCVALQEQHNVCTLLWRARKTAHFNWLNWRRVSSKQSIDNFNERDRIAGL